jgi:nucleoside-diphosphate-sugar epimerase
MYGEYDDRPKRAIPWAIQSFLRHKPVVCEFPKNIWDYMYIKDAADATVQVLNAEYYGIINIASGISRQMKDIFLEIAHIMGSEEYLSFNDNNACKSTLVADTSILNKQIGYVCQTNFCDGLETTIGWWKKNMKDYSFS